MSDRELEIGTWRYRWTLGKFGCAEQGVLRTGTGKYVALVCNSGEWIVRRWSSWEKADETKVGMWKRKEGDRGVTVDLVEDFFEPVNGCKVMLP